MNKLLTTLLVTFIFISIKIVSQSTLFVWGEIKWTTNSPAIGMKVNLIKNATENDTARVVKSSYTNETGRFAFFNIEGQPSEYSIQIYSGEVEKTEQMRIPVINIGRKVPTIIIH